MIGGITADAEYWRMYDIAKQRETDGLPKLCSKCGTDKSEILYKNRHNKIYPNWITNNLNYPILCKNCHKQELRDNITPEERQKWLDYWKYYYKNCRDLEKEKARKKQLYHEKNIGKKLYQRFKELHPNWRQIKHDDHMKNRKRNLLRMKKYQEDNKDKIQIINKIWRDKNKKSISMNNSANYKIRINRYPNYNKNKYKTVGKKYYQEHKKRIAELAHINYIKNKDKILVRSAQYYKKHKIYKNRKQRNNYLRKKIFNTLKGVNIHGKKKVRGVE